MHTAFKHVGRRAQRNTVASNSLVGFRSGEYPMLSLESAELKKCTYSLFLVRYYPRTAGKEGEV